MKYPMTIEQTVEIPADRQLKFAIPEYAPLGKAKVILVFPADQTDNTGISGPRFSSLEELEAEFEKQHTPEAQAEFHEAMKKYHGAWKAQPWKDCVNDIRKIRSGWTNPWEKHRE
jgi:hypothetical protein